MRRGCHSNGVKGALQLLTGLDGCSAASSGQRRLRGLRNGVREGETHQDQRCSSLELVVPLQGGCTSIMPFSMPE